MNEFGDDFVSFVPMHITFSPDGQFFLVSTGNHSILQCVLVMEYS